MFILHRLGIVLTVCAIAVITGISVAYLSTPRLPAIVRDVIVPVSGGSAAIQATSMSATDQPGALSEPTTPAQIAPTAPVRVAPFAAIRVGTAEEIIQQVKATIPQLYRGQIDAQIDYGNGNRSVARVLFDLGTDRTSSKFAITTTYEGASGRQTAQRTTIGERTWQRQADIPWSVQQAKESASGELQAFLPAFETVKNLQKGEEQEGLIVLLWSDANNAHFMLLIDPDTNIPRQLTRDTGTLLTVTYQGWNAPVEINPPS